MSNHLKIMNTLLWSTFTSSFIANLLINVYIAQAKNNFFHLQNKMKCHLLFYPCILHAALKTLYLYSVVYSVLLWEFPALILLPVHLVCCCSLCLVCCTGRTPLHLRTIRPKLFLFCSPSCSGQFASSAFDFSCLIVWLLWLLPRFFFGFHIKASPGQQQRHLWNVCIFFFFGDVFSF